MKQIWIRHGMTKGNREKRYIGSGTDEGLCSEGIQLLQEKKKSGIYLPAKKVYVSPMRRCLETAEILYPQIEPEIVYDFRECDFGLFENRNHEELSGNAFYQEWIDSNASLPFPEGEAPCDFCSRSVLAFLQLAENGGCLQDTAFVVHGGTIMAVFSKLDVKKADFYAYHVENGLGYTCRMQKKEQEDDKESSAKIQLYDCRRLLEEEAD